MRGTSPRRAPAPGGPQPAAAAGSPPGAPAPCCRAGPALAARAEAPRRTRGGSGSAADSPRARAAGVLACYKSARRKTRPLFRWRLAVVPGITAGGVMDVNTALQEVLKTALIHDGLARGIREAAKALDKRQAHLCVLASNCDEPTYVKLVEALCAEHQINLIKVDDNKKLGEWVGLCKIDREGKPRKVVGCSCVVVKDYGKESQAKDVIEEYFKCKK
uniref:40S ribosomal protein S12 n=1 Tax=Falco tinnunculus TaxID=100819 RepID=A0A8C4V2E7_FALTI